MVQKRKGWRRAGARMRKGGGGQGKGCETVAEGRAGFFICGVLAALSPPAPDIQRTGGEVLGFVARYTTELY